MKTVNKRQIIFRAKRIDNGKWVEGYYVKRFFVCLGREIPMITKLDGDYSEVDPNTISQFTGLKDRNGKMIFEGDIVKVKHFIHDMYDKENINPRNSYGMSENIYYRNYQIEWKLKKCRWIMRNGSDQKDLVDYRITNHEIEVIGNIWDNPELLEVKP